MLEADCQGGPHPGTGNVQSVLSGQLMHGADAPACSLFHPRKNLVFKCVQWATLPSKNPPRFLITRPVHGVVDFFRAVSGRDVLSLRLAALNELSLQLER